MIRTYHGDKSNGDETLNSNSVSHQPTSSDALHGAATGTSCLTDDTMTSATTNASHTLTPSNDIATPVLSLPSDTTHYLNVLNTYLTKKQLRVARVATTREVATLTGPQFYITLAIPDYALKEVGTGGTKQEAKNNAAKKLITELQNRARQHQDVLGKMVSQKSRHPVSLLHELVQKLRLGKPEYQLIQRPTGSDPDFVMEVSLGEYREEGRGSTKKTARTVGSWKLYKKLMLDECDEVVEDEAEGDETSDTEVVEAEEEEKLPHHFNYSDLTEYQGVVKCKRISEYGPFGDTSIVCGALVNVDELPDLDELNDLDMTRSQIIEEKSDGMAVPYEVDRNWHFTNILINKVEQLGNVDVMFEKLKTVEDVKRSFLCFITIHPKDLTGTGPKSPKYLNMVHGITLEIATEKLAYATLRHAELLNCDLYHLAFQTLPTIC